MKRLLLLNGPNINRLGNREEDIYGNFTLEDIENDIQQLLDTYDYQLDSFQSNHEGDLVDRLHEADGNYSGIIFNPAAYTHTSIALHDAITSMRTPVIEVHISNIHKRESFRHTSMLAPACKGQIVGFGMMSYRLAALAFIDSQNQF